MFNILFLLLSNALFFTLKNNLMMIIIIIIQVSLSLWFLSSLNIWVSFFLFLMYLGGIMVVYMFIISISPEKKIFTSIIMMMLIIFMGSCGLNKFMNLFFIKDNFMSLLFSSSNNMLIMMFFLLLFLMLMITKLFIIKEGPMRKIYV